MAGYGDDRAGDIRRISGAPQLVVDYLEPIALLRETQHGSHEIAAKRGVDPGCSKHDVFWICFGDGEFTLKLGSAIDALGSNRIALDVRALFLPVEHVVR